MVQDIENLLGGKSEIDRRKDAACFCRGEENLDEGNRIEEKDSDLLAPCESHPQKEMGEPIDSFVKLLIGKPLVLEDGGNPFWKFIRRDGQDLAYIH